MVILDLMLPDKNGIEVCRELRRSGEAGIIILTAREEVGDRIMGLEAGADDYLAQPPPWARSREITSLSGFPGSRGRLSWNS